MYEHQVTELARTGWTIEWADSPVSLPKAILDRYPRLPDSISAFLCSLRVATNADETAWLLCGSDYAGVSAAAFRWNEFELLALAAAEGDSDWQREIRSFWDRHFPIVLSVKKGYAYFALRLDGPDGGSVVHGYEPEFEETEVVASSFSEFLLAVARGALEDSGV